MANIRITLAFHSHEELSEPYFLGCNIVTEFHHQVNKRTILHSFPIASFATVDELWNRVGEILQEEIWRAK